MATNPKIIQVTSLFDNGKGSVNHVDWSLAPFTAPSWANVIPVIGSDQIVIQCLQKNTGAARSFSFDVIQDITNDSRTVVINQAGSSLNKSCPLRIVIGVSVSPANVPVTFTLYEETSIINTWNDTIDKTKGLEWNKTVNLDLNKNYRLRIATSKSAYPLRYPTVTAGYWTAQNYATYIVDCKINKDNYSPGDTSFGVSMTLIG